EVFNEHQLKESSVRISEFEQTSQSACTLEHEGPWEQLAQAGWRRPLFSGVCDFPSGFLGVLDRQQKAADLPNRSALRWLTSVGLWIQSAPRRRDGPGLRPVRGRR